MYLRTWGFPQASFEADVGQLRHARAAHAAPGFLGLLCGEAVHVHGKMAMDADMLHALLRAAGAQVVPSYRHATICLSNAPVRDKTVLGLSVEEAANKRGHWAPMVAVEVW